MIRLLILLGAVLCAIGFGMTWFVQELEHGKDVFLFGFLVLCSGIVSRTLNTPYPSKGIGLIVKIGTTGFSVMVVWAGLQFIRNGRPLTEILGYSGLVIFVLTVVLTLYEISKSTD